MIGVEGAIDNRSNDAFWVVCEKGLFEDTFAGARFAQDQAKAALLGVDFEDVEDFLLMSKQANGFDVEGVTLNTEVRADHKFWSVVSCQLSEDCGFGFAVVGDWVEGFGFAHTIGFVEDDDAFFGTIALETDLDGSVGQMAWSFPANGFEGEGVVGADMAVFFDEEHLVIGLVGREITDTGAIQGKTVQRCHLEDGMFLGVVLFLDPVSELAVESVERTQIERAGKELITNGSEEALDFTFGGTVSHRGVMEETANACADLNDFLRGIDGAVVDVKGLRNAAFIESRAQGFDESVDVFVEEELTVTTDAAGIVNESNESGLGRGSVVADIRAKECVGLPHFVGVSFGEGEADFARSLGVVLEHFVLLDESAEGVGSDLCACEQTFLDRKAVKQSGGGVFAVSFGKDFAESVVNFLKVDLAGFALVGAGPVFDDGNAVFLKTRIPSLNGAPSELAGVAVFIGEGHLADGLDSGSDGMAWSHVNGTEHTHFEIGGRITHERDF